jgi:hypothetical protein
MIGTAFLGYKNSPKCSNLKYKNFISKNNFIQKRYYSNSVLSNENKHSKIL